MYIKIFKKSKKKEDSLNQYFFVFCGYYCLDHKTKKERRKSMRTRYTKYGCTIKWCKRKRIKRTMRTMKEVQQKRQEREAAIYTRWQNTRVIHFLLFFFFVCFFFLNSRSSNLACFSFSHFTSKLLSKLYC